MVGYCRRKIKGEKGVCVKCGQDEHGECDNPPHCVNCGEDHPASSKKCSRYLFENEVQALRAREHLSFQEARQRVSSTFIKPSRPFSSLFAQTSSSNVRNPTDLTHEHSKTRSPNLTDKVPQDQTRNRAFNAKRKLSGEREENPSSRVHLANSYDLLQDEMDQENVNFKSGLSKDRMGPSTSASPLERPGTLIPVSAPRQTSTSFSACDSDQAGTSFSALNIDRAGISVSAFSSEQAEKPNLACEKQDKSPESLRPDDQFKAPTSVNTLERADSFVSASSEPEDLLPSLEGNATPAEGLKNTGTKPKVVSNNTEQRKNQETSNRTVRISRIPKASDNKNKKKELSATGKAKESSK